MEASASDSTQAVRRYYDLYFREGPAGGFVFRYRDCGMRLSLAGMDWESAGERRFTDYSTIDEVRLQTGHLPKSGYFGTCQITFRNGRSVTVTSLDSWGSPDGERLDDYAEFVQDLHGHLSDEDRRRIRFHAGSTPGRQMAGTISIGLGAVMFVVLPLVLAVITGEAKALFLMLGGIAFIFPAFRTLKKNEPREYDPRHLDEDLFPHT